MDGLRLNDESQKDSSFLSSRGNYNLRNLDFLWLEVTPKCNLQCVHCYADSTPNLPLVQTMSFENWKSIINDAYALGCRKIQFIGGEPTLYPQLPQLIETAQILGYEFIEVFTNGTLLDQKLIEICAEFKINLAFSIYSSNEDIHDGITQRKGSLFKTLKNIKRAISAELSIRAGIIKMQQTSSDIESTIDFLHKLGIEDIRVDRVRGIGRGSNITPSKPCVEELCGACWRGKLCIDSKGLVFPCVFSRFYKVGCADQPLQSILEGDKLFRFRHDMYQNILHGATLNKTEQTNVNHSLQRECNPDTGWPCSPECTPSYCPPAR